MTRARHRQADPRRPGVQADQPTDSSVEALLTRVRLDSVIPEPRVSPEAGPWHQPTERTVHQPTGRTPVHQPSGRTTVDQPTARTAAAHLETAAEPAPETVAAHPRETADPRTAAIPRAHRRSAGAKIPVVRSLAGVLTVIGAVAAMDFGAAAVFNDHGPDSPADPTANPSALTSPQAAAPAPAAAPGAQPASPPPAQAAPPPVPTPLPPAPAAKPPAKPAAPAAASGAGCVAPAGMTSLIDQDPSDEQVPWRRTGPGKVSVYFAVGGMPADWRKDMQYGAAQWNKSPCLDTHIVNTCPTGSNCVTVSVGDGGGDDGNFDAVEKGGYTTGGHIALLSTLTANQRKNVAVHEMGHAVGLRHRKTNKVLMNGDTYDDVFNPDATEYRNLLFDYGRQLGSNPSSRALQGNR